MPQLHESVGYFTLTGSLLLVGTDGLDTGEAPDVAYPVAGVEIVPSWTKPIAVMTPGVEETFLLQTIQARLNSEGKFIAPDDGFSGTASAASTNIRLVANEQLSLSVTDWHWTVTVRPLQGQNWASFSFKVTAAPGEARSLVQAVINGDVTSPGLMAGVLAIPKELDTFDPDTDVPDEMPDGSPVLDGTPLFLLGDEWDPEDPETMPSSIDVMLYRP